MARHANRLSPTLLDRPSRAVVSRLDVASNAGNKAPADVRRIAVDMGFAPVDFSPFTRTSRADRAISIGRAGVQAVLAAPALRQAHVLFTQHPLGRINDVVLSKLASCTSSIALVHDLESLRRTEYAGRSHDALSRYGVVIVHTPAMAAYLGEVLPHVRTVVLGYFDYLVAEPPALPALSERPEALYVIGSLALEKATYLYQLGAMTLPLPIRAYGPGCVLEQLPPCVRWDGVLDMGRPELPARDGFGLVWDGTSPHRLEGQTGTYLHYNSPHKFSMYLALGLPVIVPVGSALAALVREHAIGLVAESLEHAAHQAATCPPEQWTKLASAVVALRAGVLAGERTHGALQRALALLESP